MKSLIITAMFIVAVGSIAQAQITPTDIFSSFFDSSSTYNGQPLVIGTVVEAFDPDNTLCGSYIVDKAEGHYGFMPVYGDDPTTEADEGAIGGQAIRFEINGRPATIVNGDPTFIHQSVKQVQLSAEGLIDISLVEPAPDMLGSFHRAVRFEIKVLNSGEGLDFYGVTATHNRPDFSTLPQADTAYAKAGEMAMVTFDVMTPLWSGNDTVDVIDYTVYSLNDPSVSVSGTVLLYFTLTDIGDEPGDGLPYNFTLRQNYPNPFNPSTTIVFSLTQASPVMLQIINLLGQTVESRDLGSMSAGEHEFLFDGSSLASGIYFYRLTTSHSSQARKMILMK